MFVIMVEQVRAKLVAALQFMLESLFFLVYAVMPCRLGSARDKGRLGMLRVLFEEK
jgi:hypothetical protein